MNLSEAANWAQIIGTVPLAGVVIGLYMHHRCAGCWRVVLGHHGHTGRPACHRHSQQ